MDALELLLSIGAGLLIGIGIFLIFSYILNGLFYSKVAKEHGVQNTWMAWVPWVNTYYHGKVAGDMTNDAKYTQYYTISYIAYLVISMISSDSFLLSILTLAISICFLVLTIMGIQKIYKFYIPNSATLLAVLSIIPFVQIVVMIYLLATKIGKTYR